MWSAFFEPMLWTLAGAAVVYVLLDTLVFVPGAHFGVHLRFEERTGRIYDEGLGVKIPLVDRVESFSVELDEIQVEVTFTSTDKLQLVLKGSLQYVPDARISSDPDDIDREPEEREGRNRFFEMSESIICSGIEEALRSLLGGLGGTYKSDDFIENRQALGSLVNSILRLENPPHLSHDASQCEVEGCAMPERVDAKDLIAFYNKHWRVIQRTIEGEEEREDEVSPIERRYGIDITTFALGTVDFSEETKAAFEKKRQAEAREAAFKVKLSMAKSAKDDLDATAQEALNAADVSLDPTVRKQIVSVEGAVGVLGGILGKMGGEK